MSKNKIDKWQNIGILFAILLGLHGAGLSSYQAYVDLKTNSPVLITQMSISRSNYAENIPIRPATFRVLVHNSGNTRLTLAPTVYISVLNPQHDNAFHYNGQLSTDHPYSLPKTVEPGQQIEVSIEAVDSNLIFGPNIRYELLLTSVEGTAFHYNYFAGPITDPKAMSALLEHVKYQAKIDFESQAAMVMGR